MAFALSGKMWGKEGYIQFCAFSARMSRLIEIAGKIQEN
jgi:hypothetical protein